MEQKVLRLEGVKSSEGGQGLVEARIAAVNGPPDADGDVLVPGSVGRQSVSIVPSHDHTSVPLGRAEVVESGGVVRATMRFFLGVSKARDWFEAIKADFESGSPLQEWSWGYKAESRVEVVDGRPVRFLERIKMYEVSPVLRGASINTATLAVKSDRSGDEAELLAEAKRYADTYNAKVRAELQGIYAGLLKFEAGELLASHDRCLGELKRRAEQPVRWYSILDRHPDAVLGRAGAACADLVAAELGISPPPLSWILPETPEDAAYAAKWGRRDWPALPVRTKLGIFGAWVPSRGRAFARADLPFASMVEVVAHEVRHAAGGDEPTALAYGREWRRRITPDE